MVVKDYSYYTSHDISRRKISVGKRSIFVITTFIIIIFFVFIKSFILTPREFVLSASIISPLAKDSTQTTPSPTLTFEQTSKSLEHIVATSLSGTKGEYGIAVINLKTAEQYFLNEHIKFESASLYKLWIMASVYKKIDEGKLTLDNILSEDIRTLNEKFKINEELAEKNEGKVTLSVKDALNLMITKSDNYAALLLAANIRLSNVSNFLNDFGFTESKVGGINSSPTTTAYDIALFFNKLYNGEFSTPLNNEEILDLLKGQVLNGKIPKYLPPNTPIAHKTGEIDEYSHDAGIVFGNRSDYIIVVLTKSNFPKDANEKIAQISKDIYEYFEK